MKHYLFAIMILLSLFTTACSDGQVFNGEYYDTYGIFNEDEVKSDDVEYRVCVGNVVWGIILCETIIAPVYFFGFDLKEPVSYTKEVEPKKIIVTPSSLPDDIENDDGFVGIRRSVNDSVD